jgi:glutamate-1-semialdehyde 2,1-aminomutase
VASSSSTKTELDLARSAALFDAAAQVMPGGVNSPVRAYQAVGGTPPFIARAEGPWVWDVDGNRYVDLVASWGPLILGHRPPAVLHALEAQLQRGWTYGAPTEQELRLAAAVRERMPSMQMLRLVNSGTEAAMSAVRLARAFTGKSKLIKFAGGYHGHADALLAEAGSGVATLGIPSSPGITAAAAKDTIVCRFNNLGDVTESFSRWPGEIAAVIVEPVAGNMGVVVPQDDFLPGLRQLTRAAESLLIFDEVITGFRVGRGGAQERFGVVPDLTCLGKVLGGGLPIGGYGGRRDIMEQVAPAGPVYQAGTLSGNPLAVTAGMVTLEALTDSVYAELERKGERVESLLRSSAEAVGIPLEVNRVGSMLTAFFASQPVSDFAGAKHADGNRFASWFHDMMAEGVLLPPSPFEAAFLSTAHDEEALGCLEAAIKASFQAIRAA